MSVQLRARAHQLRNLQSRRRELSLRRGRLGLGLTNLGAGRCDLRRASVVEHPKGRLRLGRRARLRSCDRLADKPG